MRERGEPHAKHPKILVMGCGGIGGVVASYLFELEHAVYPVVRDRAVVDAFDTLGLRLRGDGPQRTIPGRAWLGVPASEGPFDVVLLTTQPTDVEAAAREVAPHLARDAVVAVFQNGLCEERVARVLGDRATVIGGVVAWGGMMIEPGLFERTSAGGFTLGGLPGDAGAATAIERLTPLLEAIGPVAVTDNLTGARWSKLALNCAITSLGAISGERLGVVLRQRNARRVGLEIITEVVAVARRLGVDLEKVAGTIDLEWLALTEAERQQTGSVSLASKHAMVLAVGLRYRRLRSSMLRAMERGRAPAVDFLNGEIVERGRRLELSVPVNAAMTDAVWSVARGEAKPGTALLEALYTRTR